MDNLDKSIKKERNNLVKSQNAVESPHKVEIQSTIETCRAVETHIPVETNQELNCIDINIDSLILHLKIISKLKPGYKLSVKKNDKNFSEIYIDTSILQYLYRIYSYNSRNNTIIFLELLDKEITKKIEELVIKEISDDFYMFLNSKENILLNLSHNLNLSLVGLNNLINTYSDDEYTVSNIEILMNNFELKIRKISNILKVNNNNNNNV